ARPFWYEKGFVVKAGRVGPLLRFFSAAAPGHLLADDLFPLGLKLVRRPFQEEHSENVLLELGRVHPAPQDVSGSKQVALQLLQGEFVHPDPHPRNFLYMTVSDCVAMSKSAVEPCSQQAAFVEWRQNYQFSLEDPPLSSTIRQEAFGNPANSSVSEREHGRLRDDRDTD